MRVSCIRVYSGGPDPMAEVSGIGASPTCGPVSAPVSPPAGSGDDEEEVQEAQEEAPLGGVRQEEVQEKEKALS